MKRTLTEARAAFEASVPGLTDSWANEGRRILSEAEDGAKATVGEFVAEQEREALELRDEALKVLTSVRDELDDLAAQASTGRLSANDGSGRLDELRRMHAQAEQELATLSERADSIASIEDDPIAWYSDLQRRMPHLLWESPW